MAKKSSRKEPGAAYPSSKFTPGGLEEPEVQDEAPEVEPTDEEPNIPEADVNPEEDLDELYQKLLTKKERENTRKTQQALQESGTETSEGSIVSASVQAQKDMEAAGFKPKSEIEAADKAEEERVKRQKERTRKAQVEIDASIPTAEAQAMQESGQEPETVSRFQPLASHFPTVEQLVGFTSRVKDKNGKEVRRDPRQDHPDIGYRAARGREWVTAAKHYLQLDTAHRTSKDASGRPSEIASGTKDKIKTAYFAIGQVHGMHQESPCMTDGCFNFTTSDTCASCAEENFNDVRNAAATATVNAAARSEAPIGQEVTATGVEPLAITPKQKQGARTIPPASRENYSGIAHAQKQATLHTQKLAEATAAGNADDIKYHSAQLDNAHSFILEHYSNEERFATQKHKKFAELKKYLAKRVKSGEPDVLVNPDGTPHEEQQEDGTPHNLASISVVVARAKSAASTARKQMRTSQAHFGITSGDEEPTQEDTSAEPAPRAPKKLPTGSRLAGDIVPPAPFFRPEDNAPLVEKGITTSTGQATVPVTPQQIGDVTRRLRSTSEAFAAPTTSGPITRNVVKLSDWLKTKASPQLQDHIAKNLAFAPQPQQHFFVSNLAKGLRMKNVELHDDVFGHPEHQIPNQ